MARLCAPALARRMGFPSVTTLHHLLEAQPLNTLGISNSPAHRLAGNLATRLVFAVDRACLPLRRYVNLAQSVYGKFNLTYIPHHVFHPVEEKQTDQRAEGRGTRLLSFGFLAPYKGIDVLLCAYEAARRSRPELRLRIAGGTHPRFPGFSERWMRDPVPGMTWLGQVPDAEVHRLMAWADVLVAPNLAATGSSSVIHRAAALGKTIVASDIPDFRALADEEQLAIEFVPPADPEALRRTLERVTSDADLRARARRANLEAARRLTPARVARQYLAVFSAVAAGSEAGALPRHKPSVERSAKEGVGDVLPIVP
jgi:glycosyltransferase involved in cell wall biosynthesis